MPAIIPIPAFTDNYIWPLREASRAAVVDPGAALLLFLTESAAGPRH